jgi:hypothetical protein
LLGARERPASVGRCRTLAATGVARFVEGALALDIPELLQV